jgi:hypothetical protein
MPVPRNRANFKQRQGWGSEPDHDNANSHDHERHDRVHRNAERAMISITADPMHMRHLGHSKKREEDEAHHSCDPKRAWLRAVNSAGMPLNCVQRVILTRIVH